MQERESEAARWRATKQPRLKDGNMKRKTWRQKRARGETEKQDWHWEATRDSNSRRLRIEDGNKKRNEIEGDKHAGGGTQTDHLPPILLLFDILVNKASLKRIVELTDCFIFSFMRKKYNKCKFSPLWQILLLLHWIRHWVQHRRWVWVSNRVEHWFFVMAMTWPSIPKCQYLTRRIGLINQLSQQLIQSYCLNNWKCLPSHAFRSWFWTETYLPASSVFFLLLSYPFCLAVLYKAPVD